MRFRTEPFRHQLEEWERSRDSPTRAIFWEQGTGKSKLVIDTAAHLYLRGEINAVLVVAPNGVHRNWLDNEFPAHLSPDVDAFFGLTWITQKSQTIAAKREFNKLLEGPGLAVLAMSYDSFVTERGKAAAKRFLTERKCLHVLDESARIKSPGALRTKAVLGSSKYSFYKRILTGTPVANGPFDIYAPMRFLDPDFWKGYGWARYQAFRGYFGMFVKGYNGQQSREFNQLVGFQHLERLHDILAPMSTRVTKDDVLDLPAKLYSTMKFTMTGAQASAYSQLKNTYIVQLENGDMATAIQAMKRLLRLQQITCGYLPMDDGETVTEIQPNARLALMKELAKDIPHSAIIWARFRRDIDQILEMLKGLDVGEDQGKFTAVRYDGSVDTDSRVANVNAFQAGEARFFVANPAAAGEGLTLHRARTVIYYSNSFKLAERLQSEDRAHRIGQIHPVHYIDLVAEESVDQHIVTTLKKKLSVSQQITGDRMGEWL